MASPERMMETPQRERAKSTPTYLCPSGVVTHRSTNGRYLRAARLRPLPVALRRDHAPLHKVQVPAEGYNAARMIEPAATIR
jgi:hypothetical protein